MLYPNPPLYQWICIPSANLTMKNAVIDIIQHPRDVPQVSGTDASKSRYREFSSGILDALQRERLMMRLEPLGLN